ncbi:MAG: hypothetical protein IT353_16875 [Gemmatimonadaceae bacterium]|nr:hypothetical protein [Gemmatimonadaceae bacterium]
MSSYSRRLFHLLATAALVACGGAADSSGDDSASVLSSAIADSLRGPGTREGAWQGADERSTWRAMLNGARITQIDEVSLLTDSTRAMRQFRFDSTETLATMREEKEQVLYGAKATPDTVRTIMELEWQGDSIVRSSKKVNGEDRMPQPYEVDNVRAHARDLVSTARAGTTTTPPAKP